MAIGDRRRGRLEVLLTLVAAAGLGVIAGLPLGDLPFWLTDIASPRLPLCRTIAHCLVDGDTWRRLATLGAVFLLLLGYGAVLVLAGCVTAIVTRRRATIVGAALVLCGCLLITSVLQNTEWP
ncbi:hypothetical protein [Actinoplanes sp. NPDC049681]|uniref:hypothetical protein n=1 Tax=Actinoplanes sp. NPDC049681 TaxID=3363905 RepID=UPI00379767CF